jgi:hypothetical protein
MLSLNELTLLWPNRKYVTGVAERQGLHKMCVQSSTVQTWYRVTVVRVEVESLVGWQDWLCTTVALQSNNHPSNLAHDHVNLTYTLK